MSLNKYIRGKQENSKHYNVIVRKGKEWAEI